MGHWFTSQKKKVTFQVKNLLLSPGIGPKVFGRPVRTLVAVTTEQSNFVNCTI